MAWRAVFDRQGWHAISVLILLLGVWWASSFPVVREGSLLGLSTLAWLWITLAVAIAHQVYVWLTWRLELHEGSVSSVFGGRAFDRFALGFQAFGNARNIIIVLAVSNRSSLGLPLVPRLIIAVLFLALAVYTIASALRHLGADRLMGLDHFEARGREGGLVNEGVFRFTSNPLYVLGFLWFWVPGLALDSAAALLAAGFYHAYIWVHYYCTEKPDIEMIYGRPMQG